MWPLSHPFFHCPGFWKKVCLWPFRNSSFLMLLLSETTVVEKITGGKSKARNGMLVLWSREQLTGMVAGFNPPAGVSC